MNKRIKIIFAILIVMTIIFAYGALLYHDPMRPSGISLEPPGKEHILGTDDLGIDVFAQVSKGYFSSMTIGILSAAVTFIIGGVAGVAAGYYGGRIDLVISFLINLFLSVPQLPIMIVTGAFFGQSMFNIVMVVALFSWASVARVVRSRVIGLCNYGYVKMASYYGADFWYLFKHHLKADIVPLLMINAVFVIGRAIVQESSLAFIGLSDPLSKSWGMMINAATNFRGIYYTDYWKWWLMPPVICLTGTILLIRFLSRELENLMVDGKRR